MNGYEFKSTTIYVRNNWYVEQFQTLFGVPVGFDRCEKLIPELKPVFKNPGSIQNDV